MNRIAVALAVGLCVVAAGGHAETAFEMAFRTGTLDAFEPGDRLEYSSEEVTNARSVPDAALVSVALDAEGSAALHMQSEGGPSVLGRFNADVGNPLAMYFFERVIRSVSEGTGGSSFYLRNRVKDALRDPDAMQPVEVKWGDAKVAATEIVLTPFSNDPNQRRLGAFGDLTIRIVVGEEVPGWYHTLRAEAGGGSYVSALSLMEVVE